jgi:hypothetical protein
MMKSQFSQPAIAGGYIPKGLTASTHAKGVFGCQAINNGSVGSSTVSLDDPIPLIDGLVQYLVIASPATDTLAAGISVLVSSFGEFQFNLDCLNDVHVAVDSGVFFAVYQIPKTT